MWKEVWNLQFLCKRGHLLWNLFEKVNVRYVTRFFPLRCLWATIWECEKRNNIHNLPNLLHWRIWKWNLPFSTFSGVFPRKDCTGSGPLLKHERAVSTSLSDASSSTTIVPIIFCETSFNFVSVLTERTFFRTWRFYRL